MSGIYSQEKYLSESCLKVCVILSNEYGCRDASTPVDRQRYGLPLPRTSLAIFSQQASTLFP